MLAAPCNTRSNTCSRQEAPCIAGFASKVVITATVLVLKTRNQWHSMQAPVGSTFRLEDQPQPHTVSHNIQQACHVQIGCLTYRAVQHRAHECGAERKSTQDRHIRSLVATTRPRPLTPRSADTALTVHTEHAAHVATKRCLANIYSEPNTKRNAMKWEVFCMPMQCTCG